MFKSLFKTFNSGVFHWSIQRISACLLLCSLMFVMMTDSVVFGFVSALILLFHLEAGFHTIVVDYMHDLDSRLVSNAVLDTVLICLAKSVFIIFSCL